MKNSLSLAEALFGYATWQKLKAQKQTHSWMSETPKTKYRL